MTTLKKIIILSTFFLIIVIAIIYTILPNIKFNICFGLALFIFINLLLNVFIINKLNAMQNKHYITYNSLANIINKMPFMICLKDTAGKVILINDKLKQTKYLISQKNITHTKSCTITEEEFKDTNGNTEWYRVAKIPIFDSLKKFKYIVEIFENIQPQKELELRKNTFIAALTHDLKTPTLAQIKGLELLLNDSLGDLNEIQKEVINQVKSSCSYMSSLIFSILDTYSYENGQISFNPKEFNINDLIHEAIGEISNLLEEKNLTIKVDSKNIENIVADSFQLKRVITNILSNAITYGYKHTEIEIKISKHNSKTFIEIKNQSPYIPEEKLKDIFEKFKTASNAKFRKTGIGLGLYISKQIIDAHHGEIYATSDKNGTCTFTFSIPLIKLATTKS